MKRMRLTATALVMALMSACSTVSQQKAGNEQPGAPATVKTEAKAKTETATVTKMAAVEEKAATPTQQQQAAAAELIKQVETATPVATQSILLPTVEQPIEQTAEPAKNSSAIPGRSGLRLGKFAPPEEAASTGERKAVTPNAAEQHGLRSPALPTKLPLDINGQSNNNNGQ